MRAVLLVQVVACVRMVGDLLASEDPGFKMVPKPQVTSRFMVLPDMIGPAIIGKGGTHAKHIKERTGVRIEVVREYQTGFVAALIPVDFPRMQACTCMHAPLPVLARSGITAAARKNCETHFSFLIELPLLLLSRWAFAAANQTNQARQDIVLHGPPERVREAYHLLLGNIRKYGPANLPAGAVPNPLPFSRGAGRG
jgi:hypothetical protein